MTDLRITQQARRMVDFEELVAAAAKSVVQGENVNMGNCVVFGELFTGFNRWAWGPSALPPFWMLFRLSRYVEVL